MSDRTLGAIFNDCIDRLAAGETIEDCLRVYPRFATDLRPMLEAGELVNRAKIVGNEAVQAEMRVQERLLRELDHTTRDGVRVELHRRQNTPVLRLVAIWLTAFFCLISTGVGGTWVAAHLGLFDDDQEGQEEIPQTATFTLTPTITLTATASPSPTRTPTTTMTLSPTVTLSATPTITQTPEGDYAPSTILPQPNGRQGPNVTQGVPNNPSNGANPPQIAGTPIAPPNNPPVNYPLPTLTPTRTLPVPPQGQQPPQFSPTLPLWVIHTMTAIAQTRTALPPLPNNPVNPTYLTPPPPNNPPINNPTLLPPPNNQPPNGQPPNMTPMLTPPAFPPPPCPPLCG